MGTDGTNTTINGMAVETYGINLIYGTWYFATDRTKVIFRPNSSAINTLQLDMSVTTTFNLILNDQSGTKVDEFTTTGHNYWSTICTINMGFWAEKKK